MASLQDDPLPCPLERLSLPDTLTGSAGSNRATGTVCQLAAGNDLQAIQAWLTEFRDSPRTLRHYRKEAERLLLWSLLECAKPLSSLTREDCIRFENFLADPQPRERWCGQRAPRFSPRWRPFLGPLGPSSRRTSLLIVNALFSYLVKAGYLAGNPLALIKRRKSAGIQQPERIERFLEHDQWQALLDTVHELPRQTQRQRQYYQRVRFLLALLYLLGPRVGEVASHTMGSFMEIRGRWWWRVVGKGGKEGRVPVNRDMLEALQAYRCSLEMSPLPEPGDTTPLVLSLKGTRGITDNMIYRIVKDLMLRTAQRLEASDPHRAQGLRRASTHWLRHTCITHQADAGIELNYLRRSARHARLDTTGLYLHAEDEHWHNAMERHRLKNR